MEITHKNIQGLKIWTKKVVDRKLFLVNVDMIWTIY